MSNCLEWAGRHVLSPCGLTNASDPLNRLHKVPSQGSLALNALAWVRCAERVNAWDTDQEMGRQAVAGQNPCVLQALTALPEGSAITEATVALSVEGNNVQVIC